MVRHPTARRTQKTAAQPDDVFVERVLQSTVWAREHRRLLTFGGIALVVLLLGFFWFRNQRAVARERAIAEMAQVRQTALSGNAALAVQDLQRYIATHGNQPEAQEARLLLAQAQLEIGDHAAAIQTVQGLASNLDRPLGAQAAFLLASAQEVAGQTAEAEQTLLRIANRAPYVYQQVRALDAAGRLRTDAGNHTGAAELYERAVNLLPIADPQRTIFEMRLEEARAAAQG